MNNHSKSKGIRTYRDIDKDNIDESISESIARTKRTIKDYARNNDFDYFVTLTINPKEYDSFSLESVYKMFDNFAHKLRRRHDNKMLDFAYLVVPEVQNETTQGIHLHGYIKGDLNLKIAKDKDNKNIKYRGKQVYNVLDWPYGFSTAVKIGNSIDDTLRCSSYITKYVTKELLLQFNKKRFWVSKGLKKGFIVRDTKVFYNDINDVLSSELSNVIFDLNVKDSFDVNFYSNDYYACITVKDKINQVD